MLKEHCTLKYPSNISNAMLLWFTLNKTNDNMFIMFIQFQNQYEK